MADSYDLRSALAEALPATGPSRATVRAMDEIGFKADPKNNDMKELFVGLDIAPADADAAGAGVVGGAGERVGGAAAAAATGPSAAQVLLDYRREKKAAEEAAQEEAKRMVAAGEGPTGKSFGGGGTGGGAAAIGGVGLARAAGAAGLDVQEAAEDERYLRQANLSKTASKMSSKQKRRRKQGKEQGTNYEDRYAGKVVNRSKRKGRMMAMKQMY